MIDFNLEFQFYIVQLRPGLGSAGVGAAMAFQFYIVQLRHFPSLDDALLTTFQFYIVQLRPRLIRRHRTVSYVSILYSSIKTLAATTEALGFSAVSILYSSIKTMKKAINSKRYVLFQFYIVQLRHESFIKDIH